MQKTTLVKAQGVKKPLSEFFEKDCKRALTSSEKFLVEMVGLNYKIAFVVPFEGVELFVEKLVNKMLLLGMALLFEFAADVPEDEIVGDLKINLTPKIK